MRSVFCFFLLFISVFSFGQKNNRFLHGERQGKWIIYYDSTERQISSIGHYRKGNPSGRWKYYDENGKLSKTEKYRFKKINTSLYYKNGQVYRKGKAKITKENDLLHFYYYGEWISYDSLGGVISKQLYREGERISETNYRISAPKQTKLNDTLVSALQNIDHQLGKYFDTVAVAERNFGKGSKQYQRALELNNAHTSKLLSNLDTIIRHYGYPGRTLVGDKYTIAFSIISSATNAYREKYLKLITSAADKGELDWTDVAFFVDKVRVGKKEKQLYCTQFFIDEKQGKAFFYPVEDPDHLNERRIKVGIGEIDLTALEFTTY